MAGWKLLVLSVSAVVMLQGIASAKSDLSVCPNGLTLSHCIINPCVVSSCPRFSGEAECVPDHCGGCNARYYVGSTEVTDHCFTDLCETEDGDRIECDGLCGVDPLQGLYCNPSCDINNGGCREDQICKLRRVFCIRAPCPQPVECLDRDELCSQELQVGTCNDRIRSFFYDIASQRCKRFFYSGCGGNDNRFATRQACRRTCSGVVEPVDPCARLECSAGSRCKVNKETGMPFCEKSCEYDNGGCAAREICRLRQLNCLVPPCPPLIDCLQPTEVCRLEPEAGPCRGSIPSYFFNSTSGRCGKFFYGGCGGNDNRFSLLEDCQESCGRERPTENPCFLIDCALGTICRVNKETGRGECVPRDNVNPCATVLCGPGLVCRANDDTQMGECIQDPCTFIRCTADTVCQFNQGTGRGECVPRDVEPPTMNRCSYVLCQPGLECQINEETGAGECVFPGLPTSCSALSCVEGTACVVDVNTGVAKCVPTI